MRTTRTVSMPQNAAGATEARRVARRAIDFVRFRDANAHGAAFEASTLRGLLQNDPAFDSLSRHRQIKKEITEAFAALEQVRRALRDRGTGDWEGDGSRLIFIELCSGRGFLSLALADAFPKARIYMIDCDTDMDVSHVRAFGPDRISFHAFDLFSSECEAFVRDIVADAPSASTAVLVGVHLCGALADRAISLYESVERVAALVLAPCCLPRRRRHDVPGFHVKDIAKAIANGVTPHQCWCTHLYFRLPRTSKRNMLIDHDMLSQQNTFLIARRTEELALDSLSLAPKVSDSILPGRSRAKWRIVAK